MTHLDKNPLKKNYALVLYSWAILKLITFKEGHSLKQQQRGEITHAWPSPFVQMRG